MDRIRTIIDKEWAEVFKNRMVLLTIILLPVLFTILPLVMLGATRSSGSAAGTDMPAQFAAVCSRGMSMTDCIQVFVLNEFMLFYMIMPIIIPITIAAYSIVGEKTTRSLEPLLATPITTQELLIGKGLAAVIPGVLATWVCFAVFLLAAPLVGASQAVMAYVVGPVWLLAVLLMGPLMAVLAVFFAIIVSSRVSDPRVAEQISAVLIVPFMMVLFGQLLGYITLNTTTMLIAIAVMVGVDIGVLFAGASLFQRETILTKWK